MTNSRKEYFKQYYLDNKEKYKKNYKKTKKSKYIFKIVHKKIIITFNYKFVIYNIIIK